MRQRVSVMHGAALVSPRRGSGAANFSRGETKCWSADKYAAAASVARESRGLLAGRGGWLFWDWPSSLTPCRCSATFDPAPSGAGSSTQMASRSLPAAGRSPPAQFGRGPNFPRVTAAAILVIRGVSFFSHSIPIAAFSLFVWAYVE